MTSGTLAVGDRGTNRVLHMQALSNETLYRLLPQLMFAQLANKHHKTVFANNVIGDEIEILLPYYAFIGEGRTINENTDFAPLVDRTVKIQIDSRPRGAMKFNDEERTLEISDFGDRYLQSMVEELAIKCDLNGAEELSTAFHYGEVSTAALTFKKTQEMRKRFSEMLIPETNRQYAILNPSDLANLAEELGPNKVGSDVFSGYDLPSGTVEQSKIRERYKGKIAGFHVLESVNVPYYETIAYVNGDRPMTNGASQTGEVINTDGWTANKLVLKKGNKISFPGVNEVAPRGDHKESGRLAQFTVTADVTANSSGEAAIPISPALNDGTMQINGVTYAAGKNVSATPSNDTAMYVLGTGLGDSTAANSAAGRYKQSIFYNREALEFVPIRLVPPASALRSGVSVDEQSGVTVMFLEDFVWNTVETKIRVDTMHGFKVVYPEIGASYIGESV